MTNDTVAELIWGTSSNSSAEGNQTPAKFSFYRSPCPLIKSYMTRDVLVQYHLKKIYGGTAHKYYHSASRDINLALLASQPQRIAKILKKSQVYSPPLRDHSSI